MSDERDGRGGQFRKIEKGNEMSNFQVNASGKVPQDIINILSENNAPNLGATVEKHWSGSVVFSGVPDTPEFANRVRSLSGAEQIPGVWAFPIGMKRRVMEVLWDDFGVPVHEKPRRVLPYEKTSRR